MPMTRLSPPMPKHQPFAACRVQTRGDQRGDGADKPIHQHHDAFLGTGQVGADQRGDFKPTEVEQGVQRVATLPGMQRQRALDDRDFVADALGIQSGARACQVTDLATEQRARQRTGGSSVANPHFAADKQLRAALHCTKRTVAPGLQRQAALGLGHRRAVDEIRRARADVQVAHTRQIQRRRHSAEVDHFELRIQLARQHTDGRATGHKVMQHLPGHFLGKGRHAFSNHAMVAGKNGDPQRVH